MWDAITNYLSFTGIEDKTVWQDVLISSFLIPVVLFIMLKVYYWWNKLRPSRQIFENFTKEDTDIYVFHSQMSSADDTFNRLTNPKYITRFPQPLPTDHANLGQQNKFNIDPVCSEADSQCVADVFNVLGAVDKTKNILIGDLIKDWNRWSNPMFSVGFNPKTHKLVERSGVILYELTSDAKIKIKGTSTSFDCVMPNDAGIIQKTYDRENRNPIFILAGLGTIGTSAAGNLLKDHFVSLGKLFGSSPFCLFFTVKIDEGKNSASIQKITPKPNLSRIIMYPFTYLSFSRKNYFTIK